MAWAEAPWAGAMVVAASAVVVARPDSEADLVAKVASATTVAMAPTAEVATVAVVMVLVEPEQRRTAWQRSGSPHRVATRASTVSRLVWKRLPSQRLRRST